MDAGSAVIQGALVTSMRHRIDHPLGWTQPVLPPLPAGEAQRTQGWELIGGATAYPPSTAPGFQAAWHLGLLPDPPPHTPPSPVPGISANASLWAGLGTFFAPFALISMLRDAPGLVFFLVLCGCTGTALWLLMVLTPRRERAEFAAGYTTRSAYLGLWRLGRGGRVLREPDRSVPPPGFYPSPYRPGLLQLWDGPGWAPLPQRWWNHPERYFAWPPRPYLDGVPAGPSQDGVSP